MTETKVRGWRDVWGDVAERMTDDDAPAAVVEVFREIAAMERPAEGGKAMVELEDDGLRAKLERLPEDDLHGVIRHIAHVRNAHERGGQIVVTVLIDTLLEQYFEDELARRDGGWNA